jgi:hypothetical protein
MSNRDIPSRILSYLIYTPLKKAWALGTGSNILVLVFAAIRPALLNLMSLLRT